MEWTEVEEQIAQDDRGKWDRTACAKELRIDSGSLEVTDALGGSKCYALADTAAGQMCERLGIPTRYWRRLPEEFRTELVNYDLERLGDRAYRLRGRGDRVRAFLSADYVTCDNRELIEETSKILKERAARIRSFVLEETHLFLKVVSDDLVDSQSGLKAGVMIGNSEVGMGSVSIEPFVYRKPCTNDLVVSQERTFRHPHVRLSPEELRAGASAAISRAFEVAAITVDRFLETRRESVADPAEMIKRIVAARKLSRKFAEDVLTSYQAEPEPTRFGVINAFTRAAQKLGSLHRIEIERFAGTLVGPRSVQIAPAAAAA